MEERKKKNNYLERGTRNGLIGKFDANIVIASFKRYVLDSARTIAVITARHLSFRRSFNGKTKSSRSSS